MVKSKEAPTFLDTPRIITLNNGNLVQMIARYHASEKCNCSWSKKGTPISESQRVKIFHEKINFNTYEYRVEIQEPSIDTSGLYKCMVKNGSGQMQVYLSLNIEAESDLDSSNDNTTIEPQKETKPEVTQQDMSSEIQRIEQE